MRAGGDPTAATWVRTRVVVVLGYRNRGVRANLVNRWRTRTGLRAIRASRAGDDAGAVLLCTGGSVAGKISEARLCAEYARQRCGFTGEVLLEEDSRTTWENIENSVPVLDQADHIIIASDAFHASLARHYLMRMQPHLARRLEPGQEHRWGEALPVKLALWCIDWRRGRPLHRLAAAGRGAERHGMPRWWCRSQRPGGRDSNQ